MTKCDLLCKEPVNSTVCLLRQTLDFVEWNLIQNQKYFMDEGRTKWWWLGYDKPRRKAWNIIERDIMNDKREKENEGKARGIIFSNVHIINFSSLLSNRFIFDTLLGQKRRLVQSHMPRVTTTPWFIFHFLSRQYNGRNETHSFTVSTDYVVEQIFSQNSINTGFYASE